MEESLAEPAPKRIPLRHPCRTLVFKTSYRPVGGIFHIGY